MTLSGCAQIIRNDSQIRGMADGRTLLIVESNAVLGNVFNKFLVQRTVFLICHAFTLS